MEFKVTPYKSLINKQFKNSYIMETTIKVNQAESQKYFVIYEVRVVKRDNGEVITYDRFLNESEAKENVEYVYKHLQALYEVAFVREQWVWC